MRVVQTPGVGISDGDGNTLLHLGPSVEGIFSDEALYGTAAIVAGRRRSVCGQWGGRERGDAGGQSRSAAVGTSEQGLGRAV